MINFLFVFHFSQEYPPPPLFVSGLATPPALQPNVALMLLYSKNVIKKTYFLQVVCGYPLEGGGRGTHVLKLMMALAPILQKELEEMWDTVIPKLLQYLEGGVISPWNG